MIEDHPGLAVSAALASQELRKASVALYQAARENRPPNSREVGQMAYAMALGAGVIAILEMELSKSSSTSLEQVPDPPEPPG